MKHFIALLTAIAVFGCARFSPTSSSNLQSLVGTYDGQHAIDTSERLTLHADGVFTYDFVPLGENGASYSGHWTLHENTVVLVAKLESGEEEEFPLEIKYLNGAPHLTYTWESHRRQRATMLIPNEFVRLPEPLVRDSHGG